MKSGRLIALMVLAAAPALAQPIIIPLEKQPKQESPPVASAPPVAPPTAGPSQPESAVAGGERGAAPEEAYQPPEKDQDKDK